MVIYNIPDDFNAPGEQGKPVIVRTYRATSNSFNNKSIIHQNMADFIISGKKTIVGAYDIASLEAGELMLNSKGSSLISQAIPKDGLFQNLAIYFTNDVFANFKIKHAEILNSLAKGESKRPFITYRQDVFLRNYINSILLLLQSPSKFTDDFKLIKVEELLLYLLHTDPQKFRSLSVMVIDNEYMMIRQVAESHITTPISVEELAFLCNASLSTFKRKFFKVYGASPQKWLTEQKMKIAANLLKQPHERSGLVYQKVGYENQSSFIAAFKNQYGVTPKEYQRRNLT